MTGPKSLLDGVLQTGESLLVFGSASTTVGVIEAARARWTRPVVLDLREPADLPQHGALRQLIVDELAGSTALIVLVGTEVPSRVRELLAELVDRQLNLPGEVKRLDAATQLLVVCPTDTPEEGLSTLFALRLPAEKALAPG